MIRWKGAFVVKPEAGKKKRVLLNIIEIYHQTDEVCVFVSTLL